MADEPASPLLGISAGRLAFDRSEPLREVCLALAAQARLSLDIVSRHLDPALFDTEPFSAAVKDLVRENSRRAQVRILVLDSATLVSRGHRLVDLGQRLTSAIALRVPAPEHRDFNEAWLVADNTGYVYRRFSDRFDAEADFSDRRRAQSLTNRFEELWNRAQHEPNFRRLHL